MKKEANKKAPKKKTSVKEYEKALEDAHKTIAYQCGKAAEMNKTNRQQNKIINAFVFANCAVQVVMMLAAVTFVILGHVTGNRLYDWLCITCFVCLFVVLISEIPAVSIKTTD